MSFDLSGLPTTTEAGELNALNKLAWIYGPGEVVPL